MRALFSLILWSALSAAFVGPGTVTTCAKSGHLFGFGLLWALTFSTIACVALQEASARVAILSGAPLGQAIRRRYRGSRAYWLAVPLVGAAIVLGCAAYQAGNVIGAVAGLSLLFDLPRPLLAVLTGLAAGALLLAGSPRAVATLLAFTVAAMGIAFIAAAIELRPAPAALLRGALVPEVPAGSAVLVIGLVGTTVVPYNLFLGSGLARGQRLRGLRPVLALAIGIGVAISMAIVVVGTAVAGEFDYAALAAALAERVGPAGKALFAVGLFAAGFSSAVTAPLAAAMTAESLAVDSDQPAGRAAPRVFRATWLLVLAVGVAFGSADVRPIPAILLAQALNGVLLPFAAIFLLLVVHDPNVVGASARPSRGFSALLVLVVGVAILLGVDGVLKAGASALGAAAPAAGVSLAAAGAVAAALALPVARALKRG